MKALARLFNALTSERLHRTNQIPLAPRVLAFKSLFGSSSQKILKKLGVQVVKKFQLYQGRQAGRLYNWDYMSKRREKYMIPTRHPPVSTDALASVDFFPSHSALKSCRESWEHMV